MQERIISIFHIEQENPTSGELVGKISHRAGQLSKNTEQFLVTINGRLWRDNTTTNE